MARHSALLNVMINAARKAGRGLQRDFAEIERLHVTRKGAADFVTSADLRAEQTIFEELSNARPKFGFVMEERGDVEGSDNSNRWIVDPLDGTTNFLHGVAHFAISIGLERDRRPYAGVVYNPATDELFLAEKGEGAFVNDRRLRVSDRRDLSECLFATGLPFMGRAGGADGLAQSLKETGAVLSNTAGVRRFGSAALDLCFVAAARYDAFWERGLAPWDVCAGVCIVREAGGQVSEINGGDKPVSGGSILATNSALHDKAQALLKV
ncbi:MAG: inositol monophosphatase family protein [Pseudomonadota bacterium]